MGERGGKKQEGFDYGNSPTEIENVDFSHKTVIMTTGAGTRGLNMACNASEIITGSFVNAKAVMRYIQQSSYDEVNLLCTARTEGLPFS
jgi:2-phosphosulfolactate phosphatase